MDAQQQANVFRLSATLFANNNYQISPLQLHRRIVEDALFVMNNEDGVTIGTLSDYIEKEYFFNFDESELQKVLHDPKFKDVFEWRSGTKMDTRYTLKKERREILKQQETKTLNDYITEYLTINNLSISNTDAIYQYLYGVFTTNVDSFRRMLEAKNVKELTTHYTPEDKDVDVINGFLDWENEEKNIAIFHLASYALEFCLLTGKKGANLKLDSLKHKTFFLDTNILYRAVGINGEDRKLRTISFLRKLRESEDEIKISKVTWAEFEGSLKSYIKRLRRSETPAIRSSVYVEYVTYDDIYRYYHQWASTRQNSTVDLFVDWINASMHALIEDFKIAIDNFTPYSPEEKKENLDEMAVKIMGFGKSKPYEVALNDAQNITWVESNRKVGENTIFSTKTFLISSDRGLYVWDSKYYSKKTPIVVMPSQWLSLLLRYVTRSKDDYRSFVCFLNIQDKGGVLSSEQINAILLGISEMTDNVEQQKYLLETIIEREFKDGVGGKTNDQLRLIARNGAERLLQQQIEDMKIAHVELKNSVDEIQQRFDIHRNETDKKIKAKDSQIEKANSEIEKLKGHIESLETNHQQQREAATSRESQKDQTIQQLQNQLRIEKERAQFNSSRRRNITWELAGVFALVALIIWFFMSTKESSSLMGCFLSWVETLEDTQKIVARSSLPFIFSLCLVPLVYKLFKDIFNTYDKKQDQ